MPKKKKDKEDPSVHKNLNGFTIRINEFGELITNKEVDEVNAFLNENVDDKKLRDRDQKDEDPDSDEEE